MPIQLTDVGGLKAQGGWKKVCGLVGAPWARKDPLVVTDLNTEFFVSSLNGGNLRLSEGEGTPLLENQDSIQAPLSPGSLLSCLIPT